MGPEEVRIARLDHRGIVAGLCQEIGVAEYLDARDEHTPERVGGGTATVAMIRNGLGFANRRLYLVSPFFKTKPVEHLPGPGITAAKRNNACLGQTLEWLYAHDPTAVFAGIAVQARHRLGLRAHEVHVETTSFSASGEYAATPAEAGDLDTQAIAITDGSSREHRQDLKQWMLALATSGEGAIPVFLRPLDENASDQRALAHAIAALVTHLREAGDEPGIYVADAGVYSEANMCRFAAAGVRWISRVPETSREAKTLVRAEPASWQTSADEQMRWFSCQVERSQGVERWLVVLTEAGLARTRATMTKRAQQDQEHWERHVWHLGNQAFACQADAETEVQRRLKTLPSSLHVDPQITSRGHYAGKGRPAKAASPLRESWYVQATVRLNAEHLEREVQRRARLLVATNVLDATDLPDEQAIDTCKAQSGGERGFAFLKHPLFLASSVLLKKWLCRLRHLIG